MLLRSVLAALLLSRSVEVAPLDDASPPSATTPSVLWRHEDPTTIKVTVSSDRRSKPYPSSVAAISHYRIILGSNATAEEQYAADRLQHWLQAACDCRIPVVSMAIDDDAMHELPMHQLAVGRAAASRIVATPTGDLGLEGFVIKSDTPTLSVAITGAPRAPRGTIYGVYEYLERIGFGFWDSNATTVPRNLSSLFLDINERQMPMLRDWRHCNNANLELEKHAEFSIAARQNNNGGVEVYTSLDVEKTGGGVRWASPPGFVHTSFTIVPPSEFKSTHPQWFGDTQLCWTNVSLLNFMIQRVKTYLDADTSATVISVSQNDGGSPCHTTEEDRVALLEGSDAGPLLRGVNTIADGIKDDYPHVVVETLAYTYTRKAPKLTRPRPNVVIRLSNIECDFLHPLENRTTPANAKFMADLDAWSLVSNRTWIWTYVTDFGNFVQPWPDYMSIAANIQTYAKRGVTGVYQEGQYKAYGGDLQVLKSWLGMKLMWNASQSTEVLIQKFAVGYYGRTAAPFVLKHIEIFVKSANTTSLHQGPDAEYLSPRACLSALANLQQAKSAVKAAAGSDDVDTVDVLYRLAAIELGTTYVVLLRWDEMRAWAATNGQTWPASDNKTAVLADFNTRYRLSGMDVRVGFKPTPIECNRATNGTICYVLDNKLQPSTCGFACAAAPCTKDGQCDIDSGLSEGGHGLSWFNQTVLGDEPAPSPPPSGPPSGPPGKRCFPDCHGYDCGPGSAGASPPTVFGDRCFAPGGGSSHLGPFVCCNATVPPELQAKEPCALSSSVHGCWWPVKVGCPGVPKTSVCPLDQPYVYGTDNDGWFCCETDAGPRKESCDGSCCLTPGRKDGCQGARPCYPADSRPLNRDSVRRGRRDDNVEMQRGAM